MLNSLGEEKMIQNGIQMAGTKLQKIISEYD